MDVLMTNQVWENDMCSALNLDMSMNVEIDAINDSLLMSENKLSFNDLFQWREACLEQYGDFLQSPQLDDDSYFLIY